MASDKTKLTELGTAVGLCYEPSAGWPAGVEDLTLPGIEDDVWKPVVVPATGAASPEEKLLLRAIGNGREFRNVVLRGRAPDRIEWTGSARTTWTSDVPRDLTVDGVYFIQAKYDSTCVLNTAPAALADHLLAEDGTGTRDSWFEEVALPELQAYWRLVRGRARTDGILDDDAPADVRDLDPDHRAALKRWMRTTTPTDAEDAAYLDLCRAVSIETKLRWEHRLRAATLPQITQMLFRMLRIAGGPYWLLGTKASHPVRLAVADTRTWRDRHQLKRFTVRAAQAGQPQVDWRATVLDRATDTTHHVDGYCELRWSHGKLQGNPECKVQVTTPLEDLPGYDPLA